jgi:hypothetical protein
MILDTQLQFSAAQAITVTAPSTNVIDVGIPSGLPPVPQGEDIGPGGWLKLMIISNAAFAASGAATLQISLQVAPDNGSGSPGTYYDLANSDPLSISQLNTSFNNATAVRLFPIEVPPAPGGIANLPRFYRLNFTVATGPFTAGTITAYLCDGLENWVTYKSGIPTQY